MKKYKGGKILLIIVDYVGMIKSEWEDWSVDEGIWVCNNV